MDIVDKALRKFREQRGLSTDFLEDPAGYDVDKVFEPDRASSELLAEDSSETFEETAKEEFVKDLTELPNHL